ITRVDPGGLVEISQSGVRVGRHWDPEARQLSALPAKDWPEALRDQLDAAVRRRLRGAVNVGAHLSAGLDSGGVAASTALILRDSGRRLTAFTAVPGAELPDHAPDDRLFDEGPGAAAVAAMYPNIDHVRVSGATNSLMADLERTLLLAERPPYDLFNHGWIHAVFDAARARNVDVLLTGETGNLTLSYEGLEHLPLMLRQGRLRTWLTTATALAGENEISWRRLLARTLGPFAPSPVFARFGRMREPEGRRRAAVGPISDRVAAAMVQAGREAGPSPFPRLWRNPVAMRLWALARRDPGPYNKAALAGWGVDLRDPTADLRLLEFCLAVPGEEHLPGGRLRALARRALVGRLPDEVLHERRRGLQGADWAARLTADRDALAAELEGIAACEPAAGLLDVDRARGLFSSWPDADQEDPMTAATYRFGLVRAISAGHFARSIQSVGPTVRSDDAPASAARPGLASSPA
ncbi:MAG: asparagine synthase-related protein, partial [Allosphingosinicella sp.]